MEPSFSDSSQENIERSGGTRKKDNRRNQMWSFDVDPEHSVCFQNSGVKQRLFPINFIPYHFLKRKTRH